MLLNKTASHGYSLALGQLPLRQRISRFYDEWYGARLNVENIAVTVGSSTAFALTFLSAFDEGDHIAIPNPGYPAYRNLMMALGLEPVSAIRRRRTWLEANVIRHGKMGKAARRSDDCQPGQSYWRGAQ